MTSGFLPNQFEFLGKKIFVAQNHPNAGDDTRMGWMLMEQKAIPNIM